MRRLYYDLTGLPPTPKEVDAFLADQSPDAYEKLVDRLLASPHYGEKWGRHWLDLVRYAETNSYERDNPKPNVWRYRDYVIRAFNDDKPYDRSSASNWPATRCRTRVPTRSSPPAIIGSASGTMSRPTGSRPATTAWTTSSPPRARCFSGLTVDCARCHDHKIDPIPQKDYYRLLSFFQNINPYQQRRAARRGGSEQNFRRRGAGPGHRKNLQAKLEMFYRDIQDRRAKAEPPNEGEAEPDEGDLLGEERYKRVQGGEGRTGDVSALAHAAHGPAHARGGARLGEGVA